MISGLSFWFWRFMEIITLVPAVGMLSWFVDRFTDANLLTPDSILVLFIVSVLGLAWAVATIVAYGRAKHSGRFVAFVDLVFVGAFIAGVYYLRSIAHEDCTHVGLGSWQISIGDAYWGYYSSKPAGIQVNKECAMLKASWAFGIMNCIFFFVSFLFALLVARHHREDRVVVKETHVRRHSHRGSSHHSRSPRRSHHSSHRDYYP